MGDIADYLIGQFPACYDEEDNDVYVKQKKTCYKCGEKGLSWVLTYEGWALEKNGVIHKCKNKEVPHG